MAKNVKAIYDTCAKLIKTAETQGNKIDQSILDALQAAYTDIMNFEKIYLIQCQDRFWGTILMDIDFGIDFSQQGPIDLKIDRSPFMLGVNPLWCADYKFPEFTGLIVNELVKMVYLHPADFNRLNHENDENKHETLDKASSAASSSIVKKDIRLSPDSNEYGNSSNGCRLPNGTYTPTTINSDCNVKAPEEMPLEFYYNILNKFKKKPDNNSNDNSQDKMGNISFNNNQQSNQATSNNTPADKNGASTKTNSNGKPTHNWESADKDEVKEQITSIVSNCFNSLDEKHRGMIPSSVMSQIKALLEPPEIDWKGVLRKMVGSVPVPYRKTRTRLNRRQPYRADLCGKLPKRICNIVCCFDTSGSMSDDDLKYCMNEVFNIIKVYEGSSVTIIECDAEVQRVYQAKSIADVKTKMCGRGK